MTKQNRLQLIEKYTKIKIKEESTGAAEIKGNLGK